MKTPTFDKKKNRTCLKCGKEFMSSGAGHRICDACSGANDKLRLPNQANKKSGRVVRNSIEGRGE